MDVVFMCIIHMNTTLDIHERDIGYHAMHSFISFVAFICACLACLQSRTSQQRWLQQKKHRPLHHSHSHRQVLQSSQQKRALLAYG